MDFGSNHFKRNRLKTMQDLDFKKSDSFGKILRTLGIIILSGLGLVILAGVGLAIALG